MDVNFLNEENKQLIEKGKILMIGGSKGNILLTGNSVNSTNLVKECADKEEAKELFIEILLLIENGYKNKEEGIIIDV